MLKSLNTASTGMVAQQTRIDVISNNIANVNTTGFRRARAEFQDLLYQTVRVPGGTTATGAILPTGMQIGQGTRTASTVNMHTQGSLAQTDNPLDIAIEGSGFLQVRTPNGELSYTRAGNLKTDPNGQIVTVDGYMLEPNLIVPAGSTSITISADGMVTANVAGQTSAREVGQLQLAHFPNPAGLMATGKALFVPTVASGDPFVANPGQDGVGTIAQGFLEGSNVEVVTEMIDLITSQRAYDINKRVIDASDEMLRRLTQ